MAKNNDITTSYRLDVSDLKKGLDDAKQAIKLANATFKAETAGMDDWTKSAEGLQSKIKQLTTVLDAQKTALSNYKEQLERAEAASKNNAEKAEDLKAKMQALKDQGVSETSEEFKKYQRELELTEDRQAKADKQADNLRITIKNQEAAVAGTEKEIRQYNEKLDDLEEGETDAAEGADDASDSIKKLGDETDKAENKTNKFASALKTGLVGACKAVVAGVASAVTAMSAAAVSAAQYADDLNTMSTVTGISTEDLQAYSYAADLVDVSLDTLTSSLTKNTKAMSQAASGSKKYVEAYEELGVSVTDADGNLRDSEEVFWEVIEALGKIDNETERDAKAMDLLGKSAQQLNPLIKAGADTMAELKEEAKENGAVLTQDTLDAYNGFNDVLDRLKARGEAAKNTLGAVLMPVLQELGTEGADLLGNFTKGMQDAGGDPEKMAQVIGQTVNGLAQAIVKKAPEIIRFGFSLMETVIKGALQSLPELIPSIVQLITELVDLLTSGIRDNIGLVMDAAFAIINGLLSAVTQILPKLAEAAPQIVKSLVDALTANDNIKNLIAGALELLKAIITAIPIFIENLLGVLPDIITAILDVLMDPEMINLIISGTIELLQGIIKAIPQIIIAVVKAIPQIVSAMVEALTKPESVKALVEGAFELMWAIITAIPMIIVELGKAMPDIVTAIGDGLSGVPEIFANIWNGIVEAFSAAGEWFGQTFSGAYEKIKEAFAGIGDWFRNMWETIVSVFSNIGTAIGDSMGSSFATVINGAIDLVERVINGAIGVANSVIDAINAINPLGQIGHIGEVHFGRIGGGASTATTATNASDVVAQMSAFYSKSKDSIIAQQHMNSDAAQAARAGSASSTNFTQIINAPKSPSRADVYRDTKNLLALVGG